MYSKFLLHLCSQFSLYFYLTQGEYSKDPAVAVPPVKHCCVSKLPGDNNPSCLNTHEEGSPVICIPYSCASKSISQSELNGPLTFSVESCTIGTQPPDLVSAPSPLTPTLGKLDISLAGYLTYNNYSWNPNSYCIDTSNGRQHQRLTDLFQDPISMVTIYICMDTSSLPRLDEDDEVIIWVYLVITSVAASILFFTMLCFIMSRKIQTIHGWTQFTHVLAFFMAMVFWSLEGVPRNKGTASCTFVAVGEHFFYISLFSWLLVVNYDVMLAFRTLGQAELRSKSSPMTTYLFYSAVGWGVPLTFVGIGLACSFAFDSPAVNEHNTKINPILTYIAPMYGLRGCSLAFRAYWLFLILPNAILMILVFVMFLKMIQILQRQRKLAARQRRKNLSVLGAKILFLMGPFWFLDLITMMHVAITKDEFIWYILLFDIIVFYEAIPLFVIYICRPDTLLYLQDNYPRLRKLFVGIGKLFCVKYPEQQVPSNYQVDPHGSTKLRVNRRPSMPGKRPERMSVRGPKT